MAGGDRKGTFKVEFLKDIEKEAQEKMEYSGVNKAVLMIPFHHPGVTLFSHPLHNLHHVDLLVLHDT